MNPSLDDTRSPPLPPDLTALGRAALLLAATLALAACAGTPAPNAQLAVSTAALTSAAAVGGGEAAPLEMRLARDKLARANLAMAAKDYDVARSLAEEAEVDAQLAGVKARSGQSAKAAAEVQDASRALREEMNRQPQQPQTTKAAP
jgi:hypothetical protein